MLSIWTLLILILFAWIALLASAFEGRKDVSSANASILVIPFSRDCFEIILEGTPSNISSNSLSENFVKASAVVFPNNISEALTAKR